MKLISPEYANAEQLGKRAYFDEKPRVPAHDRKVLDYINDMDGRVRIKCLHAWFKGWDMANIMDGRYKS